MQCRRVDSAINEFVHLRDAWIIRFGCIFGKTPNSLCPTHLFSRKFIVIFPKNYHKNLQHIFWIGNFISHLYSQCEEIGIHTKLLNIPLHLIIKPHCEYKEKWPTRKRESLTCLLPVRLDPSEIEKGCTEARRGTNWGKYFKFENITNIANITNIINITNITTFSRGTYMQNTNPSKCSGSNIAAIFSDHTFHLLKALQKVSSFKVIVHKKIKLPIFRD